MNRHTSNPFLSDWDTDGPPANTATSAADRLGQQQQQQQQADGSQVDANYQQQPSARRSSCSQAEFGPSAAGAAARQGLYRRNMSSFEAASLQLEQHQQQMLENGSVGVTQKELIAKMTADFQSAISKSDRQFALDAEQLDFNPFDPFETIVDDDVVGEAVANGETPAERVAGNAGAGGQKHDSIDDDEEELVSTPVRNIKSSEMGAETNADGDDSNHNQQQQQQQGRQPQQSTIATTDDDSRTKASMFASLLASAESGHAAAAAGDERAAANAFGADDDSATDELNQMVENSTHVIKGSPSSAGGTDAQMVERPVGFFDPFETVIDKDALSELMSGTARQQQQQQQQQPANDQQATSGNGTRASSIGLGAATQAVAQRSVAESASIETVIENSAVAQSPALGTNTAEQEADEQEQQQQQRSDNATGGQPASSARALQYDSSMALGRPAGRKLEQPASGFTAPQPTPLRRPKQRATQSTAKSHHGKSSVQEDNSSDSEDEDERIQIVIKAKAPESEPMVEGDGTRAVKQPLVPLLPPPPSKSSMKQARERGQVGDMPSPIMGYKSRIEARKAARRDSSSSSGGSKADDKQTDAAPLATSKRQEGRTDADADDADLDDACEDDGNQDDGQFVIPMRHSDLEDEDGAYGKSDTPLYDDDTSYVLEEFPAKYEGPGWEMMLRYPPKKKITSNRFWKKIFVKLAQVPLVVDAKAKQQQQQQQQQQHSETTTNDQHQHLASNTCWALQIFDKQDDKKPMQEIPIQATYTVSEISSQLFDQFGKIFTIKLQYIFYKERVGVRQGQLARFIHTGHIGTSTTSGGHGVDPISIGAIKRMGAPIEHSPQVSQIIKLGCANYEDIKQFKDTLEDCLFRMSIQRDRALSTYKTEEVQMAVRDETYLEVNQIGTITRQMARVRLFFLSFLNGTPTVEVGVNDIHRQGREVVGRMDILPVVTEEWIRLEAWELHSTVDKAEFENTESRMIKLSPPDATFFELMRFRVRPPRNRELPLQISANMSVTRTRVCINCEVMIPGCVSRKHGQIPCENIAIRVQIPECWIYFFREEKHFRMGSKKSVNRRPGKVKGIERFLGGGGGLQDIDDESSLIEVTSGQAKYEHHHHAVVWRAARWPKESQTAYVQNTMKIRLPLTAYDKMPESFYEFVHVEYTMPATTVSHTTLRSIAVAPCDDEPPEKYVKYSAKYEYKVKMRLSVNIGAGASAVAAQQSEASPIVIMKQPDLRNDLQKEEDSDDDDDDDDDAEAGAHCNETDGAVADG